MKRGSSATTKVAEIAQISQEERWAKEKEMGRKEGKSRKGVAMHIGKEVEVL